MEDELDAVLGEDPFEYASLENGPGDLAIHERADVRIETTDVECHDRAVARVSQDRHDALDRHARQVRGDGS